MHQFLDVRAIALFIVLGTAAVTLAGCDVFKDRMFEPSSDVSEPEADLLPAAAKAGDVLVVGGGTVTNQTATGLSFKATETTEIFTIATQTFAKTGSMKTGRGGIQAVGFPSGALKHQVLVPGGVSGDGSFSMGNFTLNATPEKTSELFKASAFSNGGTMKAAREFYTATLLADGTVLIAGGLKDTTPLKTAELYDPATKTYTSIAMKAARGLHTATLLPNGRVLLIGGITDTHGTTSKTAELYDPVTKTFANVPNSLPFGLAGHTATLIAGCSCSLDGKVLIAGGFSGTGNSGSPATEFTQNSTYIYDPTAKTFTTGLSMREARALHTATLIGGKVHVIAGSTGTMQFGNGTMLEFAGSKILKSAEVFTASSATWACVGGTSGSNCANTMKVLRGGHTATYFASGALAGKVLVIGGNPDPATEIYNPATGKFAAGPKLKVPRGFHAAVLIP